MWRARPTSPDDGSTMSPVAHGRTAAPELVGMSINDARRAARMADLQLEVEERPGDQAMWGRVLDQDPQPGVDVKPGATISVVIGGRRHVRVPDVRGRDEAEALNLLREAGLSPERRSTRPSDKVPEGQILRTRPRAGTEVAVGSRVAIVVASGPKIRGGSSKRSRQRVRASRLPDGSFMSLPED